VPARKLTSWARTARTEAELWREERWGAVVPLAGLADDNAELLRQAANEVATEWADQDAARLFGCRDAGRDRRLTGSLIC